MAERLDATNHCMASETTNWIKHLKRVAAFVVLPQIVSNIDDDDILKYQPRSTLARANIRSQLVNVTIYEAAVAATVRD